MKKQIVTHAVHHTVSPLKTDPFLKGTCLMYKK